MNERERRAWEAILANGRFASELVTGLTLESFADDRRTFYAATRCLEIVSEASRRLRGNEQANHPLIAWRQIEDAGNVFRHDYDGVEERRVWFAIVDDIPVLLLAAQQTLKKGETGAEA